MAGVDDLAPALGVWAARAQLVLGVAYVVAIVSGFASNRNLRDPVRDPHLAVAEILILVMAPVMVILAVAIHQSAPPVPGPTPWSRWPGCWRPPPPPRSCTSSS